MVNKFKTATVRSNGSEYWEGGLGLGLGRLRRGRDREFAEAGLIKDPGWGSRR